MDKKKRAIKVHRAKEKPVKCPKCGSDRIADILWGMPAFSEKLEKEIEEGKVVLGGCCVTDDNPEWSCADCGAEIHQEHA